MPWIVLKMLAEKGGRAALNLPIPVSLRILIKWSKHDRKDDLHIVADKVAEVFVVPEVKSTLGDLSSESQVVRRWAF